MAVSRYINLSINLIDDGERVQNTYIICYLHYKVPSQYRRTKHTPINIYYIYSWLSKLKL